MGYQMEKRLTEKHKLLMPLKKTMPDKIYQNLKDLKPIIMGGAIRAVFTNTKISDYDLYARNDSNYNAMYQFLYNLTSEYKKDCYALFDTNNSITYKIFGNIVQLVKLYKELTITDKLSKFDFTVCQAAYDFETDYFYYSDNFLVHNAQRQLIYTKSTEFPISTMIRVKKYLNKGYSISNTEYLKILLDVQSIKFETFSDFRNHIIGIDATYLIPLINLFDTEIYHGSDLNSLPYDKNMAIKLIEKFIELSRENDLRTKNEKDNWDRLNPTGLSFDDETIKMTELLSKYAISLFKNNSLFH